MHYVFYCLMIILIFLGFLLFFCFLTACLTEIKEDEEMGYIKKCLNRKGSDL